MDGSTDVTARPAANTATPFDAAAIRELVVDEEAYGRRIVELAEAGRRLASDRDTLGSAIDCLDLTSLAGDDTDERIGALCGRARRARSQGDPPRAVAAVCVFHRFLPLARRELDGSEVAVAVACGGFPAAMSPLEIRAAEIEAAVADGADEIDAPILRPLAIDGEWRHLYDELYRLRTAAGSARLKVILAAGELPDATTVARAGLVAAMAGADFVKTSTGKDGDVADLGHGLAIAAAIRRHRDAGHRPIGLKAAGGIRTAADACSWAALAHEELGTDFVDPRRFRIGASSLLGSLIDALAARGGPPSAGVDGGS